MGIGGLTSPLTLAQRAGSAREVVAVLPPGTAVKGVPVDWLTAYQLIARTPESVWAFGDPVVSAWLQQFPGYNAGVVGQLIAAYQGGYRDFSDPYIQSIVGWARDPTAEELAAGYQAVAASLAGRGDTSLEQAVQAGFFNKFPDVDHNWLGSFIAGTQASRDSSLLTDAARVLAPVTALPALMVGGTVAAAGVTGNINSTENLRDFVAVDAAGLLAGAAIAGSGVFAAAPAAETASVSGGGELVFGGLDSSAIAAESAAGTFLPVMPPAGVPVLDPTAAAPALAAMPGAALPAIPPALTAPFIGRLANELVDEIAGDEPRPIAARPVTWPAPAPSSPADPFRLLVLAGAAALALAFAR